MPAPEPTRCILLTPPRRSKAADWPQVSEQSWDVIVFDDAPMAMAEIAIGERAQASRCAWGLQRAASTVLAIDEPELCPQLKPMLAALARYMPGVGVWDCSQGQLVPMTLPTVEATPASEEVTNARSSDDSAKITRDELDMLLETGGCDQ